MSSTRQTFYPSQIPLETNFMQQERDSAKSLWQFILDALGSNASVFTGLPATPGTGLDVSIGSGTLYQFGRIDPTTWSDMSADTSSWMLQALLETPKDLTGFTAPITAGQSIDYLIQAQIQVTDAATINMPFTDGQTPPSTVYQQKSPSRSNVLVLAVKAGTAATTGSQVAPTADSGWVPLYVVTVDYGETSLTSADIVLATGAPEFYGFVHTNPNGNTPVYLNPTGQQSGGLNISGTAQVGGIVAATALLGGASATTGYDGTWKNGFAGDFLSLTSVGFTGSKQATDSLNIAGSIGYTGTHAGTDADPWPESQINAGMFGGKLPSDYALASGHYLILYAGAPSADPTNVNASIGGYLILGAAQGTAPLQVTSTTLCPNLNAQYVGGYTPGNASGDIPVSNGTLNANLNAEYLNGQPSSAFQPAGAYAVLNAVNIGDFYVSGQILSTGGTGSNQIALGYSASNSYGINSGGAIAYLNSLSAPLALIGPSVRTNGPLYVGDATPQNAYMADLVPSGLLRSGQCLYTVTYGGAGNVYPRPGSGTAFGTFGAYAGQITVGADALIQTSSGPFYLGFRCKITLKSSLSVNFAGIGLPSATIYVDGVAVATVGNGIAGPIAYTFSTGTHTVDIVYAAYRMPLEYYIGSANETWGGSLTVFGWIPFSSGQIASAITALVPG